MHKFIIDVNLPNGVPPFNSHEFIHVSDIDLRLSDTQIWDHAKKLGLTIVSKDSDFSNMILLVEPPPKVIHIRFGNLRLKDFIQLMTSIWPEVLDMHNEHKLVNVYKGYIEGIN
jgi:predicted nuclease of predicted toxin-antitoxin system